MPYGPVVSLAGLLFWPGFYRLAPGLRHQAPKAVLTRSNSGPLAAHLTRVPARPREDGHVDWRVG